MGAGVCVWGSPGGSLQYLALHQSQFSSEGLYIWPKIPLTLLTILTFPLVTFLH